MRVHRTIVTAAHVVFTCPNKFDGRAAQALRNDGCLTLHVRIDHCASAKTTAGKFSMKSHLFGFQAQLLGDGHLIQCLKLRRDPGLRRVAIKTNGGIQRLHWRMGQIWKLVLSHNPFRWRDPSHRLVVTTRHRDVACGPGQFFVPGPQLRTVCVFNP